MIDSITTNIFVVLVYLIPGSIITYIMYVAWPYIFLIGGGRDQGGTLQKYIFIVISLFLGVLLHALTQLPSF